MTENEEKAKLIKDALLIVDKLSKYDIDDPDDINDVSDLIDNAKRLTRNKHWKLN